MARSETRGAITGLWVLGFGGEGEIRLAAGLGEVGGSEGNGEAAMAGVCAGEGMVLAEGVTGAATFDGAGTGLCAVTVPGVGVGVDVIVVVSGSG